MIAYYHIIQKSWFKPKRGIHQMRSYLMNQIVHQYSWRAPLMQAVYGARRNNWPSFQEPRKYIQQTVTIKFYIFVSIIKRSQ